MPVRHVLLDADGVLQHLPAGWPGALEPFLGDRAGEFLRALAMDEQPALRGAPFLPVLAALLTRFGVSTPVDEVYAAVWDRIELAPSTGPLVRDLREAGLGVHLATSQNPERAAYMRRVLPYDALLDHCFYSCEIGLAKPDPAFFAHAVGVLGVPADEVLLVDDSARNVEGARSAGLQGVQWHLDEGLPALRARLANLLPPA